MTRKPRPICSIRVRRPLKKAIASQAKVTSPVGIVAIAERVDVICAVIPLAWGLIDKELLLNS